MLGNDKVAISFCSCKEHKSTALSYGHKDILQQELGFKDGNNYFSREKSNGDDTTLIWISMFYYWVLRITGLFVPIF